MGEMRLINFEIIKFTNTVPKGTATKSGNNFSICVNSPEIYLNNFQN